MVPASRNVGLVLLAALPLAGCGTNMDSLQNGTKQVTQGVSDNYQYVKQDVQDMFTYKPNKLLPKPVPPSYCYRVLEDIVCYRNAEAGWEDRLVAYQGSVLTTREKPVQEASAVASSAQTVPQSSPVSAPDAKPAITPLVAMPSPETPEQKAKTQQSMAHFASQPAVSVGAAPDVKADPASQ